MKKHTLSGSNRELTGKKVKSLRSGGQIPATIYGNGLKSVSITLAVDAFHTIYKEAGKAGLIELTVDGKLHPVLVHNVQIHPVSDEVLHVEFYQVNLKQKVHAKVAVEHAGESPAVVQKIGVFLVIHDSVEVEALPAELPEKLSIDISALSEVNQEITAGQILLPEGVSLVTDLATVLVKIGALVTKEAEQQAAVEATEAAEAATSSEAAEKPAEDAAKESSEKPSDK